MIRILVDTNVVLDVLADRALFADDAAMIFKLCDFLQTQVKAVKPEELLLNYFPA